MKKIVFILLAFTPISLFAQIGLKGGINFANVTEVSSINNSNQSGFAIGAFLAPKPKGFLGFRTELIYSKQGYNFDTNTNTGNVNLDYILLPQLSTINITKFVQIQLGLQMAFLINAKAEESNSGSGGYEELMDYYNKIDHGFAGGLEIHPIGGLLVGARINLSFANLYKDIEDMTTPPPSFIPEVNVKNNVVNLYVGWHFGK
jgi:hypothetical protein